MLAVGVVVGLLIGWPFWLDQVLQRQAAERRVRDLSARLDVALAPSAAEVERSREGPCPHAREIIDTTLPELTYQCLGCGRARALGPVFPSDYCHRRTA
jgi:hypothetical protein